jgi:hypothetical protein
MGPAAALGSRGYRDAPSRSQKYTSGARCNGPSKSGSPGSELARSHGVVEDRPERLVYVRALEQEDDLALGHEDCLSLEVPVRSFSGKKLQSTLAGVGPQTGYQDDPIYGGKGSRDEDRCRLIELAASATASPHPAIPAGRGSWDGHRLQGQSGEWRSSLLAPQEGHM